MSTPLGNAVQFFKDFGLFDVVLPFLLVFSIMFAILEKTLVLGTDTLGDKKTPKKAMNAMVAFVVALFVVATNKIVTAIQVFLPNIVLIIVVVLSFLLLVGILYKDGEFNLAEKETKWKNIFVVIIFILISLTIAGSITKTANQSYLSWGFDYAVQNFSGTIVTSLIFLAVVIFAISYITKSPSTGGSK